MPIRIPSTAWVPIGVEALEKGADEAVRSVGNILVVAGPGAGKTELLAQRACYLLQTGLCSSPRRILAISFKRDAARNLRERVSRRCGSELANRFDSYTFDSFCKNLVDRFLMAVPEPFRPQAEYQILDGKRYSESKILDLMREVPTKLCALDDATRNNLSEKRLFRQSLIRLLPSGEWPTPRFPEDTAAEGLWQHLLHDGRSAVSFPMLALIAELLLRTNPLVLTALRSAYQYVFLDEFQDTSFVHYAFTYRAFKGSSSVVTAVGDGKQRIMVWAGALTDVFDRYLKDFGATSIPLTRNYRSRRLLVRVQSVIASALDPKGAEAVCLDGEDDAEGECRALAFPNEDAEAAHLAQLIAEWINSGIPPREICVLTRMRPADYTARLQSELAALGVASRVENEIQDLIAEPLTEAVLDLLKLAYRDRDSEAWSRTVSLLKELSGEYEDGRVRKIVDRLLESLSDLKDKMESVPPEKGKIEQLLREAIAIVGESRFRSAYPQYLQDEWYNQQLEKLAEILAASLTLKSWSDAIDDFEGLDSVPIMTTHKSKGLEYHSVIFVGLEDGAYFSYQKNPSEEQCGFFVALSRAKERVIFTFSGVRSTGKGGTVKTQQRDAISDIYEMLATAGVEVEKLDE